MLFPTLFNPGLKNPFIITPYMKVIFVLLLVFNNVTNAQTVKVVGIADGDTFTALFADEHTERIRLHSIDCPETGQPSGKRARNTRSRDPPGWQLPMTPGRGGRPESARRRSCAGTRRTSYSGSACGRS